jgi:radical SAM superfamily enzyme YgiQ (UPF0313 family)
MKAVLVGIAGSNNAYSLSLYNLKGFALNKANIRDNWNLTIVQYPLVNPGVEEFMYKKIANTIYNYSTDFVAFSVYMWNISLVNLISSELLKLNSNIKICWGGPEISLDYVKDGEFDKSPVHLMVSGEGEVTFSEILTNYNDFRFQDILGLSWRRQVGDKLIINDKRPALKTIADIPSPFLSGVVDDEVLQRADIEANIETQRGCNLRCSYCVYHKDMGKVVYSNSDRVYAEILFLMNKGVKKIRIVDANFTSDINYAKEVLKKIIAAKFKFRMMFELIPGFIDEEFTQLMHKFNSLHNWNEITVGLGVQTINLEVLKTMRRRIKIEKFELTFDLFQKYNIYSKIDLIIGLPGEDISSIERTLEYMINKLQYGGSHLLCCHVMRGLPGTELLTIAKKYDMVFSSKYEPHEFIESPLLSRADMLLTLRRTGVIFRLINHNGWADREFISGSRSEDVSIRDSFFDVKKFLGITNIELVDMLVRRIFDYLVDTDSDFAKDNFPRAETWWWVHSIKEIPNDVILSSLSSIKRNKVDMLHANTITIENI